MRRAILSLLPIFLSFAVHAQTTPQTPAPDPTPAANPARPTASVPAVLPPTGYLQFEQGINRGVTSPSGTAAQTALNQATKIALTSRFLVQVLSQTTFTSPVTGGGTGVYLVSSPPQTVITSTTITGVSGTLGKISSWGA